MEIKTKFAMPNKNTFSIKPINDFIYEEVSKLPTNAITIDPFANDSKIATITNDLNKDCDTNYNMDALDFLKTFEDNSVDLVFYDPPYTPRQVKECYDNIGIAVHNDSRADFWSKQKDEISRIVKPNGVVLSFGYSGMGVGKAEVYSKKKCSL